MKLKYFFLFFFLFFTYSNIIKANENIVYVDTNFIMNNSLAGQSINSQLKKMNDSNINNFVKTENELKLEENKLLSQKNVLDESEYIQKVEKFKAKVKKHNDNKKSIRNNFNKIKFEAQTSLLKILRETLSEYAKKNSISLILNKEHIVIGRKESDITDLIVKDLNLKIKKIEIK